MKNNVYLLIVYPVNDHNGTHNEATAYTHVELFTGIDCILNSHPDRVCVRVCTSREAVIHCAEIEGVRDYNVKFRKPGDC